MIPLRLALPALAAAAGLAAGAASAAEMTVKSLIGDGFTVVSSVMTAVGPGLFLQKADRLYLCFVTERRDTPVITTNYCKPVE